MSPSQTGSKYHSPYSHSYSNYRNLISPSSLIISYRNRIGWKNRSETYWISLVIVGSWKNTIARASWN
ncbi:hypothetical protein L1987_24569 [Smallanthus sonchifolius]|uniref:Uncharacterized protein n=1 Tax=Smallanthus sonchifolius TaxID=185202 RepID=A0ACB9IK40_9ASTR|nr:hypothetical protein L1987_24569 [Smallanthus sonchifolius]